MCLAAGDAPIIAKRRAMELVNKVKILPVLDTHEEHTDK
jgi:hypothetical protein